ncbi:MAG: hypothetical protein AMXMBFR58_24040 [Phycisphaerae bacterium]
MRTRARPNTFRLLLIVSAGALLAHGCAPPVMFANAGMSLAEVGTTAFIEGELRYARRVSLDVAAAAYEAALDRLGFPIRQRSSKPGYIYLSADQENGEEIQVRLTRNSNVVTSIRIRIGLLGDQAIARLIMEEAETILKQVLGVVPENAGSVVPAAGEEDAGSPTQD